MQVFKVRTQLGEDRDNPRRMAGMMLCLGAVNEHPAGFSIDVLPPQQQGLRRNPQTGIL